MGASNDLSLQSAQFLEAGMSFVTLSRHALSMRFPAILTVSVAMFTACGTATAPNANAIMSVQVQRHKSTDLLYVSNQNYSGKPHIDVFTYPQGKLSQTLTNYGPFAGECVDKDGDVFGTVNYEVVEYAHGASSPKAILQENGNYGTPLGCAINPVNGDLAVANTGDNTSSYAVVAIYKHAKGSPAYYTDGNLMAFAYCAYDNEGNLFLDGTNDYFMGYVSFVAELPKGSTSFTNAAVSRWLASWDLGGVQWDGQHLAVGDKEKTIYRFSVKDGQATEVGATKLGHADRVEQFWIDGSDVIGGNTKAGTVDVWKYPAGGPPIKTIKGLHEPVAVAISHGR
jgi:hypothetical protein